MNKANHYLLWAIVMFMPVQPSTSWFSVATNVIGLGYLIAATYLAAKSAKEDK